MISVRKALPLFLAAANLRAYPFVSAGGLRNRHLQSINPAAGNCTILVEASILVDNEDSLKFECLLDGDDFTIVPLKVNSGQQTILENLFNCGKLVSAETVLQFQGGVIFNSTTMMIDIPSSMTDTDLPLVHSPSRRNRRLTTVIPNRQVLVVKVTDVNNKAVAGNMTTIENEIFGSSEIFGSPAHPMNLADQMSACSYKQQTFTASLILDNVHIGITMDQPNRSTSRNAMIAATRAELGLIGKTTADYDNIMFLISGCDTYCPWLGYAFVNTWFTAYNGDNYKHSGIQMHGEYGRISDCFSPLHQHIFVS